jgi:hypothetical protein
LFHDNPMSTPMPVHRQAVTQVCREVSFGSFLKSWL